VFLSKATHLPFFSVLCTFDSKASAKLLLFFDICKFFGKKMQKKCIFLQFCLIMWDFLRNFAPNLKKKSKDRGFAAERPKY
jgi:hypothetical protein